MLQRIARRDGGTSQVMMPCRRWSRPARRVVIRARLHQCGHGISPSVLSHQDGRSGVQKPSARGHPADHAVGHQRLAEPRSADQKGARGGRDDVPEQPCVGLD